jgi:CheY-like chemotaxis protein
MDDEESIRTVAARLLRHLGFQVDTVPHGGAALEAVARAVDNGQPFRAAVLDLTIVGGRGGADIAKDLRRISPDTRLILSSGYARDFDPACWDAHLQKPYSYDQLSDALQRALQPRV